MGYFHTSIDFLSITIYLVTVPSDKLCKNTLDVAEPPIIPPATIKRSSSIKAKHACSVPSCSGVCSENDIPSKVVSTLFRVALP